ncbi:MAG: DUF3788 domain-containing protein [Treponema sp.]|nr:DUF3788 domain-containing protein [Treponema sp.]
MKAKNPNESKEKTERDTVLNTKERMLNKQVVPAESEINDHIGIKSAENIELIKNALEKEFEIKMELKFPFGNDYGWGYKVSTKSKHLFYLFFEKGCINIMLQISKIISEKETGKYNKLSEEGKKYWENKYPCGKHGGWIHYRVKNKKQLKDIGLFLSIKTNREINI